MTMKNRAGIYIHIPFCVQKCVYCDFNSYAGCSEEVIHAYFQALYREADLLSAFAAGDRGASWENGTSQSLFPADTVFIGGGTPSSVESRYLCELLPRLPVSPDAEITIEINPGTVNRRMLQDYRSAGIHRVSMGVQSFHEEELRRLGRIHDVTAVERSFELLRECEFERINFDLMFGFPGQTMKSWERTVKKAIEMDPGHISFYSLQIEEGTPLYEEFRLGLAEPLPETLDREMYHEAFRILEGAGYRRYEISNAARPGQECRHNLKYWSMVPYAGIGAGAHSFFRNGRFSNPENIAEYISFVDRLCHDDEMTLADSSAENDGMKAERCAKPALVRETGWMSPAVREIEMNTKEDSMTDCLFTMLRRREGLYLPDYESRFGVSLEHQCSRPLQQYLQEGLLVKEKDYLFFSDSGIDVSNHILADLMECVVEG